MNFINKIKKLSNFYKILFSITIIAIFISTFIICNNSIGWYDVFISATFTIMWNTFAKIPEFIKECNNETTKTITENENSNN